ncbi:MAG: hypothetical protein WAQ08_02025 [Aquabacterium sp.]|jgi:hypothetical protein|uniref:hypothetical protein n=1 Tax=Aquabacterium sp. TaxID=1872578 RepID=UPI003BB0D69C
MRLLLASIAAALFLSGCAAPVHKHEVAGLQRSENIHFVDARPKAESEQELFSALITSDAYATYRYSTSSLDPSAVRLFQHKVFEKFADSAKPVDVKVYHFVSYMNMQSAFRRSSIGAVFGVVGAVVAVSTQKNDADFKVNMVDREQFDAITAANEYTKSFFTEAENPNKAPVFVVYIDADINGKRTFIRGLAPTTRKDGQNPYLYVVENTISAFLDNYQAEAGGSEKLAGQ